MKAFNTGDDAVLALVDTDRYPIDALETPEGAAFLQDCQDSMAEHGWCNLDGFIRPEAIAALREEARALLPTAQTLRVRRTIYQGQVEDGLDQDDLLNREYTPTWLSNSPTIRSPRAPASSSFITPRCSPTSCVGCSARSSSTSAPMTFRR